MGKNNFLDSRPFPQNIVEENETNWLSKLLWEETGLYVTDSQLKPSSGRWNFSPSILKHDTIAILIMAISWRV